MSKTPTRMTRQRSAILNELRNTKSHPTAWDVFETVRRRLPRISLGTVYRNLDRLCEQGLAQKLDLNEEVARYDAIVERHYHLKCAGCGRVIDLPIEVDRLIDEAVTACTEFEITGYSVDFYGLCPNCRDKQKDEKDEY
ncbi:MAG: transcriptional repressor [bacterium]|nr:transcriptional repressor [bacterium]